MQCPATAPWSNRMAKVDCMTVPGVELFFHSLDHGPPHFHALRPGEWELRVFFLQVEDQMLEPKWMEKGVSAGHRKSLTALAAQHRRQLLAEFDAKVNTDG